MRTEPSVARNTEIRDTERRSWYERNQTALNVLGLAALSGGMFAAIYFTAGTTLPWVVSAGAKLGVDLAFLTTSMSTLAASGVTTAMGLGAIGVLYGAGSLLTRAITGLVNYLAPGPKPSPTHGASLAEKDNVATIRVPNPRPNSPTQVASLLGSQPGTQATVVEETIVAPPATNAAQTQRRRSQPHRPGASADWQAADQAGLATKASQQGTFKREEGTESTLDTGPTSAYGPGL